MENIDDYILPLHIDEENHYLDCVNKKIDYYIRGISKLLHNTRIARYHSRINDAIRSINSQKAGIQFVLKCLLKGKVFQAYSGMDKLLEDSLSIISVPLKDSNAFVRNKWLNPREDGLNELYLFKGRITESYGNLKREEMFHIPLNKRGIIPSFRYSIPGIPCLYLADNSYVVWKEMKCPDLNKLTISSFCIDDKDFLCKKIFDLTLPIYKYVEAFEDPKYKIESFEDAANEIIRNMTAIPLIIACSVTCDNIARRDFIIEYAIPQLIMYFINEQTIGVAYRSNRINSISSLPANNLAIPILDYKEKNKFGEYIKYFKVSDSLNIGYFSELLNGKNSLYIPNNSAKGPRAIKRGKTFSGKFAEAESTFNKDLVAANPMNSYNGEIAYTSSVFYTFDEYLLFLKEIKKIKNEVFE